MGSNPLPTNGSLLIGLATRMHTGLVDIGAQVPVTTLTATELQTTLGLFTTQDSVFNTARSTRQSASDAFQRLGQQTCIRPE